MPTFDSRVQWPGWETVRLIGRAGDGVLYEIQRTEAGQTEKAALKFISISQDDNKTAALLRDGCDMETVRQRYENYLRSVMSEYGRLMELRGRSNVVAYEDIRYAPHSDGLGWDVLIKSELLMPVHDLPGKCISEETVRRVGEDIANALILFEDERLLLRAVDPLSICVTENGTFKLAGYGAAKSFDTAFASPEAYHNQLRGPKAAVYSLGLTLYWLLNEKRLPFLLSVPEKPTAQQQEAALARRMSGETLPPPKNGSPELKSAVKKACEFSPMDRCSASELQEMLHIKNEWDEAPAEMPVIVPTIVSTPQPPKAAEESTQKFSSVKVPDTSVRKSVVAPATRAHQAEEEHKTAEESTRKDPSVKSPKAPASQAWSARKKNWIPIAGVGAAAIVAGVLLLTGFLGDRTNEPDVLSPAAPETTADANTAEVNPPPAEIVTPSNAPSAVETDKAYVQALNWTDWTDTLPQGITGNEYAIECRQVYRSTELLSLTDTNEKPGDEYQFFDSNYGEWGGWSGWQLGAIAASDTVEVQVKSEQKWVDVPKSSMDLRNIPAGVTYVAVPVGNNSYRATRYEWVESILEGTNYYYNYRTREVSSRYINDANWSPFTESLIPQEDGKIVNMKMQYRYAVLPEGAVQNPSMDNFAISNSDYSRHYFDIPDDAWYSPQNNSQLQTVDELGILIPDSYMRFRPDEQITIGQLIRAAVIINRIYNGYPGLICENDGQYQAYADYAVQAGMILKGEFPDLARDATRQEMAYVLSQAIPEEYMTAINDIESITDMDMSRKYYDYALTMARAGIISVEDGNVFHPEESATRAQTAAMIEKLVHPSSRTTI